MSVFLSVAIALLFIGCNASVSVDTGTATKQSHSGNTTVSKDSVVAETPQDSLGESDAKETVVFNYENSVLRHAVFFKFKEGTSQATIKKITDAFSELPKKIPAIIDFQWGENNSPEKLDDGFTHCFLLTFADEEGRAEYLPHPAHKAFGEVLGGHNSGVFVIDYWGKAGESGVDKELKHAVFFKFQDDAAEDSIQRVEEAFAALPSKIDAIKSFEWGKNNSPEKHDAGFTHCFMVTFDSEKGRETYLPHPDHKAFVEVLKPVLDKVRVLDFWETK
jgi:hypothetical protein